MENFNFESLFWIKISCLSEYTLKMETILNIQWYINLGIEFMFCVVTYIDWMFSSLECTILHNIKYITKGGRKGQNWSYYVSLTLYNVAIGHI